MRIIGLFAGIGGLEVGFHQADPDNRTTLLCDFEKASQSVLMAHFPETAIFGEVRELIALPASDVITAGFPCQDLSQAGRTAGIRGTKSGVVSEVFRLLERSRSPWILLENVPFMLQLDKGEAMRYLTSWLDDHGFSWAYRVLDTRAFGLPQRRQRVILLASRTEDPREVLFQGDEGVPPAPPSDRFASGFYWTEGQRGLGWAPDAVPTLKGGSGLGIPSPPAIRFLDGFIGTPTLRDAERLQGFEADWTKPAADAGMQRARWKLVGNAVSVPVAKWVAERLAAPEPYNGQDDEEFDGSKWPTAAWSRGGTIFRANLSAWPVRYPYRHLDRFLIDPAAPLSARAAAGFLSRATKPTTQLNFVDGFLDDVRQHLERMTGDPEGDVDLAVA